MSDYLNWKQYGQLLQPVNPVRVHQKDGMSHMEAYDVRAHLNRIFGFGRWSAEVISMDLVNERFGQNRSGKDACYVVYRAGLRLTVCAPDGTVLAKYTEYAAGDALGFPVIKLGDAHDFAMKTAESQALKRAATNLGDQFGLSLYNRGNMNALVGRTLVVVPQPEEKPEVEASKVDEGIPEVQPEDMPDIAGEAPEEKPEVANPVPAPGESKQEIFDKQLAQARGNREQLNALGKWAHNAGAPEHIVNQIKAALSELDQAA